MLLAIASGARAGSSLSQRQKEAGRSDADEALLRSLMDVKPNETRRAISEKLRLHEVFPGLQWKNVTFFTYPSIAPATVNRLRCRLQFTEGKSSNTKDMEVFMSEQPMAGLHGPLIFAILAEMDGVLPVSVEALLDPASFSTGHEEHVVRIDGDE